MAGLRSAAESDLRRPGAAAYYRRVARRGKGAILKYYADTSFLASLYVLDASTHAAAAAVHELREPLPFTGLAELELQNTISLRVFRRQMTPAEGAAAWRAVQADVAAGVLAAMPVPASVYERAVRLSRERTPGTGCRSLDVLHVALALVQGAEVFLTFDRRQRPLARAEGLKVPLRLR